MPSDFIASEKEEYKTFVERVTKGDLRSVPVYYAAKDLVRAAILEHRNVDQRFVYSEQVGAVRGFDLKDARGRRQQQRNATSADLVVNCVAVLRAAGIPARPVIGLQSGSITKPSVVSSDVQFVAWAEFYLPGAGWVPFDPNLMRGTSMRHTAVQKPWRFFGTIENLNRRAAIAYAFAPSSSGAVSKFPCGWSLNLSGVSTNRFHLVDITVPFMVVKGSR